MQVNLFVSKLIMVSFTLCILMSELAFSKTFVVKPSLDAENSVTVQGSNEKLGLQSLLDSELVKGGDIILLENGNYGKLTIKNKSYDKKIIIKSKNKYGAKFGNVFIYQSAGISFDSIAVSPIYLREITKHKIFEVSGNSEFIELSNSRIFSAVSIVNWSARDWNTKAADGVFAVGNHFNFENNEITNVNFALTVSGNNSTIRKNKIENFSGDGLRGLGDYNIFENNIIKNCYQVNDNHVDGFQSWSEGPDGKVGMGVVRGGVLRSNFFLNSDSLDRDFYCGMQAIGMFDGIYQDWIIENNIIVFDHWHGITVLGARNVKILNNTVFDRNPMKPGPGWIMIADSKLNKPSTGNLVANNLSTAYNLQKNGVLAIQNQLIRNPYDLFVDPGKNDFRLKKGSRAIDAGMNGLGDQKDYLGNSRVIGKRIDAGAIEYQD